MNRAVTYAPGAEYRRPVSAKESPPRSMAFSLGLSRRKVMETNKENIDGGVCSAADRSKNKGQAPPAVRRRATCRAAMLRRQQAGAEEANPEKRF
jgi:hypothetical protein